MRLLGIFECLASAGILRHCRGPRGGREARLHTNVLGTDGCGLSRPYLQGADRFYKTASCSWL